MTDTTEHTCYVFAVEGPCAACDAEFGTSPAGIVTRAVKALGQRAVGGDRLFTEKLADLLQIHADDMSDEHAIEREYPDHIPSARWQVVDFYRGDYRFHYEWDAALALARAILTARDPNAVPTPDPHEQDA